MLGSWRVVVNAARDEETRRWFVESSDLPGLNVEADSLAELIEGISGAVVDLIEEGG